jgi:hypothetical protein
LTIAETADDSLAFNPISVWVYNAWQPVNANRPSFLDPVD